MRRRDITEEMVSIKGKRKLTGDTKSLRVSVRGTTASGGVSDNHYPVLL